MSIRIMTQVFEKSKTRAEGRLTLLALADNASDEGECKPSVPTIARKAGVSQDTARAYLHAFEKIGLITITGRALPDGKQTSNSYKIHSEKIGDDEIPAAVLLSCRPPSQRKSGPLPRLEGIEQPSTPPIPCPSSWGEDESSVLTVKLEEEEEEAATKKPATPAKPGNAKVGEYIAFYEKNIGYPGAPGGVIYEGIFEWAGRVSLEYWKECITAYAKNNGHTFTFLERILTDGPREVGKAPASRPTTRPPARATGAGRPPQMTSEQRAANRARALAEAEAQMAQGLAAQAGD